MKFTKKLINIKKNSEVEDKKNLYSLQNMGFFHFFLLKKKIAIDINHPSAGLRSSLFLILQDLSKKNIQYLNQNKLKEKYFSKLKKLQNYKFTRVERNLPLRGQRTHTNAKTRRKRKVL